MSPPTVTVPLSVMPVEWSLVSCRSPPTSETAISRVVDPLSTSAFPVDPVVFKVTASVSALVEVSNVIVALLALVVKEEVPVTARATVSVILPVVAVTLRFPPTAPSVAALI